MNKKFRTIAPRPMSSFESSANDAPRTSRNRPIMATYFSTVN